MIDGSETETIDDGPARWSPEEKDLDPFDPFDFFDPLEALVAQTAESSTAEFQLKRIIIRYLESQATQPPNR